MDQFLFQPLEITMRKSLAAFAVCLTLLASSVAMGQLAWTSTPKAPHHRALVEVTDFEYGGSGTIFRVDADALYVISCRHVVQKGSAVMIRFPNGQKMQGTVVNDGGPTVDLCVIKCPHKFKNWRDVVFIPVADAAPRAGQFVECSGYGVDGDGGNNLRHWVAKVHGYESETDHLLMETSAVSGDSGGGVIYGGKLVGVIWGGEHRTDSNGKELEEGMFVHPATATNVYQIKKFIQSCIPWFQKQRDKVPDKDFAVPGRSPRGSKNPGGVSYATTADLNAALVPVQGDVVHNKSLIESLGVAVENLHLQLGASQEATAQAIAAAKAKAEAERDALQIALSQQVNDDRIIAETATKDRHILKDAITAIKGKTGAAVEAGESKFGWINSPKTWIAAAGLLGVTGIPGIGAGFAAWIALRRIKKRIGERGEPGGSSDVPFDVSGYAIRIKDLLSEVKNLKGRLLGDATLVSDLSASRDSVRPLEIKIAELAADAVLARSANQDLQVQLAEAQEHTRTEYVHIPVTNQEAEAWKCAARRVAGSNPQAEPIVQLIQGVAEQIFHGSKVMAQDKRDPLKLS